MGKTGEQYEIIHRLLLRLLLSSILWLSSKTIKYQHWTISVNTNCLCSVEPPPANRYSRHIYFGWLVQKTRLGWWKHIYNPRISHHISLSIETCGELGRIQNDSLAVYISVLFLCILLLFTYRLMDNSLSFNPANVLFYTFVYVCQ